MMSPGRSLCSKSWTTLTSSNWPRCAEHVCRRAAVGRPSVARSHTIAGSEALLQLRTAVLGVAIEQLFHSRLRQSLASMVWVYVHTAGTQQFNSSLS